MRRDQALLQSRNGAAQSLLPARRVRETRGAELEFVNIRGQHGPEADLTKEDREFQASCRGLRVQGGVR